MDTASTLPVLAIVIPVVTAICIVLARRTPVLRDVLLFAGAAVTFVVIAGMVPAVLRGEVPTSTLGALIPGLEVRLQADGMGMVFALLASFLWVLASSYAAGYVRGADERHQTRFAVFYALCLATTFGVAFSADLFTFFVFYELLTATTYPLVTHKGTDEAIRAGRKYLGFLLSGGVAVLLGLIIVVQRTGDVAFAPGGFIGDSLGPTLTTVVFLLFAVGFGTKAGLMPLHAWLPAAMVAPTPVSALLHAVAVVKAGVFAFGRLIGFVFGPDVLRGEFVATLLAVVAGTTIVVASGIALRQDHLKRRLAYSTIAHLAYIVLAFALLSPSGFQGALLHIVNHGAIKITLFFCAGAIYVHTKRDRVSQLDGIGRKMPVTMTAFAIASLGLVGLPPMGGFVSKWTMVRGAYESGHTVLAALMVLSGLLTAAYLFPIVLRAFFRPAAQPGDRERDDASPLMVAPLAITAGVALLLGLGDWLSFGALTANVAATVMGGR
ncbi:MAG: monovalent cation/H+ antiporter subunit D family protein [Nitriliruptoraceae bacterium]